jgi:hypothetical protein
MVRVGFIARLVMRYALRCVCNFPRYSSHQRRSVVRKGKARIFNFALCARERARCGGGERESLIPERIANGLFLEFGEEVKGMSKGGEMDQLRWGEMGMRFESEE